MGIDPYPVGMTGWWKNTGFRAGLATYGVVVVEIAVFLAVLSTVTRAAWLSWALVVFVPLGLLVFMTAVLILVLRPWRQAADIEAMLAGRAWVHWSFDEAGWRDANRFDERRYTRWLRGLLAALAVGVLLLMIGLLGGRSALDAGVFGGAVTFLASVTLVALVTGNPVRMARRAERGDIYISRQGIYRRPGGYTPLDLRGNVEYESVELIDWPTPHIHIVERVWVGGTTGGSWHRKTLTDVGVPRGHEDEARALVARLRSEVVNAPRPQPRQLN